MTTPQPKPSSLVHAGARTGARCPHCASDRLTELSMTLTDGTLATLRSCRRCERRVWSGLDGPLSRDQVLAHATKR
ncbi:MAG TPA: hypothetical protein VG708_12225 [Mycobacteriales bacterium]|nr:hypothetical protein [Mycobacteriales bacterium]